MNLRLNCFRDDGKAWVKALSQLLNAMKAYVIDYHKSGLMWKGSVSRIIHIEGFV